jgi:hypothetical protein
MIGARSTNGREEESVKVFDKKARRKESLGIQDQESLCLCGPAAI